MSLVGASHEKGTWWSKPQTLTDLILRLFFGRAVAEQLGTEVANNSLYNRFTSMFGVHRRPWLRSVLFGIFESASMKLDVFLVGSHDVRLRE